MFVPEMFSLFNWKLNLMVDKWSKIQSNGIWIVIITELDCNISILKNEVVK